MRQDLCVNYTTKTFIIKTTPMRNPFRIPPILMWLFFVVHRPNSKFENTFYNLSLFVLVSPIIVNWQNPCCKEAPQINIKLFNGCFCLKWKLLNSARSPREMLDPSQLFLCGPQAKLKTKINVGLGPVPSCIPNQSQLDLPTSHPLQLPHDSSVLIILYLFITGSAVRAVQTIFCGL